MRDVTTASSKPSYSMKDWAINLFIAGIPTGILVTILKTMGISGFIIPIASLLFFSGIAKVVRENKSWSRKKTVLITLVTYLLIFFLIPMIFIAFF